MTRMRFSDFKAMYQSPFNDLYHALLGAGAKTEPGNVVIGLNVDRLKEAFQRRWQEFVRLNPDKILGEPASDPELDRSEEHTSELQSLTKLVCRLHLEKKIILC